jgi:hypothetical protein
MELLFLLLATYFIPAIVAGARKHHNAGAIFMLNLLLGWTLIGWVGALVWACTYVRNHRAEQQRTIDAAYIASGRTPPAKLPDMSRWSLKDTQAYLAQHPQPVPEVTDLDRMHARAIGRPLKNV